MEFKLDLLLQEKKSVFRIVIGILIILVSVAWVISRFIEYQDISVFDWIFGGIFALNGIVHILGGFGVSFLRVLGESYILINNDKIALKSSVLAKERSISWHETKSIEYKSNRFKITKTDNTTLKLDFSKLGFAILKEVKEVIGSLAKEKGVPINL